MYKILYCIVFLFFFLPYLNLVKSVESPLPLNAAHNIHRKLNLHVNPSCDIGQGCKLPSGSALNLIHIEAIGPNDTIHYIWSTYNIPTIIVAQTSHNAALMIEWQKLINLQSGGLWFTENPIQSTALILTQLWQYNDKDDRVFLPINNTISSVNLTDFCWSSVNVSKNGDMITAFASAMSNDSVFSRSGAFSIEFSASGISEATKKHPHLLFNGNSTQMRLTLNNLVTESEKNRFAIELLSVSSTTLNKSWHHDVSDSIDDEYSPGVFKIHHLYPPQGNVEPENNFLMWKPVAYLGEKPTVANSSDARISELVYSMDIPASLIPIFYNNTNVTKVSWNMTFGTSGDGWYEHTKYTSWSVMIGIGDPTSENLSLLAKIVIGIGLGAPCAIILGGSIYLLVKKLRKDDDDELLLAQ